MNALASAAPALLPGPRHPWRLHAWLACLLLFVAAPAFAALSLSPASLTLTAGSYSSVRVSGSSGEVQAESRDTRVATVTVSRSENGATLRVYGRGIGSTTITVRDSRERRVSLSVKVTSGGSGSGSGSGSGLSVSPGSLALTVGASATIRASNASGSVSASASNPALVRLSVSGSTVSVTALAAGSTVVTVRDSRTSVPVPVNLMVGGTSAPPGTYVLMAWNDLGMHCVDGKDYSIFSILPPFNNLHAQLVNASTGKVVTQGVRLTYEAVADPAGSLNTRSSTKTNFWTWVGTIYGASPAPDVGLTGNPTPSLKAAPMAFDAANGWFEASGIPITPYDDAGAKNYYPTVKVTARDGNDKVLATTTTVLPVSDEMTCVACHASRPASETNAARLAARPAAGWVNDPDAEVDWKKNILRLHDEKMAGHPRMAPALEAAGLLPAGLLESAIAGKPALCAACHGSNALPGTGMAGISALTSALHSKHGQVADPATSLKLDATDNRSACYLCHPGSQTKCLRGAMGNAVDANGNATMGCQSCHGNMAKVGDPSRAGWLDEPNCQACHFDGKRTTSAVDAAGNLVRPADKRFATTADAPAAGFSLYRFSTGHGGLQCEACHGATHAVYPSSHLNDNLQSIALQGYAGTLRECSVCHASVPSTTDGGPHGMHPIGSSWVRSHGDRAERNTAACAYCHGADYRGSPLSQVKVAKSFSVEGGTRSFTAGQAVGCYDCHRGPNP